MVALGYTKTFIQCHVNVVYIYYCLYFIVYTQNLHVLVFIKFNLRVRVEKVTFH